MLRKKLGLFPLENAQDGNVASETKSMNSFNPAEDIANEYLQMELELSVSLKQLKFSPPVEYIYNPLEYAISTHSEYVRKYSTSTCKILFLGMNPGPWGMSQTGVPFGEVNSVREWFQIEGEVGKPERECPERKVLGFACQRSEISGERFWGFFRGLCDVPENFFRYAFIHNYCPLAFMNNKGNNITPTDIKGQEQANLHDLCDKSLLKTVLLLKPEIVVGIGRYAEKRAVDILKRNSVNTKVLYMRHPSPRVPKNENWSETAQVFLNNYDLAKYFNPENAFLF